MLPLTYIYTGFGELCAISNLKWSTKLQTPVPQKSERSIPTN